MERGPRSTMVPDAEEITITNILLTISDNTIYQLNI